MLKASFQFSASIFLKIRIKDIEMPPKDTKSMNDPDILDKQFPALSLMQNNVHVENSFSRFAGTLDRLCLLTPEKEPSQWEREKAGWGIYNLLSKGGRQTYEIDKVESYIVHFKASFSSSSLVVSGKWNSF